MLKKRLLYFYPEPSSFIGKDIAIFEKHFNLKHFSFSPSKKLYLLYFFLRQKLQLLRWIFSASCVVVRFGGYHALLPLLFARLFNKPSILIIGGTEAHYFPAIHYGSSTNKLYGWATGMSLRLARHLAPVDESLIEHAYRYDPDFPGMQGIRNLYPEVHTPFTVIHNGYDAEAFHIIESNRRKPRSFLTVANAAKGFEYYLKGIDLILELAGHFPDCTFTIAGNPSNRIDAARYPNVILAGKIEYHKLVELYNSHEFYLQLSVAEGFPNTLCEAMLCGCIPIGSDVFSIPKIIGDTGYVLKHRNSAELKRLIDAALDADRQELPVKARKKIVENYSLNRREKELLELIGSLTDFSK